MKTTTKKPLMTPLERLVRGNISTYDDIEFEEFEHCCGVRELGCFPENQDIEDEIKNIQEDRDFTLKQVKNEYYKQFTEELLGNYFVKNLACTLLVREQSIVLDLIRKMKKDGKTTYQNLHSESTRNKIVLITFIPTKNLIKK